MSNVLKVSLQRTIYSLASVAGRSGEFPRSTVKVEVTNDPLSVELDGQPIDVHVDDEPLPVTIER